MSISATRMDDTDFSSGSLPKYEVKQIGTPCTVLYESHCNQEDGKGNQYAYCAGKGPYKWIMKECPGKKCVRFSSGTLINELTLYTRTCYGKLSALDHDAPEKRQSHTECK